MQYCDGGDLCAKIKAQKNVLFPESKVLHWFVQMALGLHYMHEERVLHRDLKTQVYDEKRIGRGGGYRLLLLV
jgi:NIMA (never in mitosis gene a)-related kinase 1/4/5